MAESFTDPPLGSHELARLHDRVLQSAHNAYVAIDAEGLIFDWNAAAEQIFGWSRSQALGQPMCELIIPPRFRERHQAGVQQYLRTGEGRALGHRLELAGLRATGEEFPVEMTIVAAELHGRPTFHAFVADISERRRNEAALEESARQLAEAQALARIGSWEWALGQPRPSWSDELCRICGVPPGFSPTAEEWTGLIHPDDRSAALDRLQTTTAATDPDDESEFRILARTGEVRWVRARRSARTDPSGQVTHLIGTIRDVTELRAAREATRQAQELFETAFSDAPIGMALVALDGRWLKVNRELRRITGYDGEALLALTFQDITHPEDLDTDLELVRQLVAGEIPSYTMEKRYVRRGGEEIWVHLSVSLVRDEAGAPRHFIAHVKDISGRKADEMALRQAKARLQAMFDHIPAGLALRDLEGRYLHVNEYVAQTLGSSPDELIGHSPAEHLGEQALEQIRAEDRAMLETKRPLTQDYEIPHADGTAHHFQVVRYPILGSDEEVAGFGAFSLDVTEQKRSELDREYAFRELEEAQRLARVGSWSWDTGTGQTTWSSEMYRIFGRDPALGPATGEELFAHVHPEDRERVIADYAQVLTGEKRTIAIDYRVFRATDGALRRLRGLGRADSDRAGLYRGTIQDVTELREAELEAIREHRHTEAIIAAMQEGYALTVDGRIEALNDALCRLTGFAREELLGSRLPWPFWPPESVDQALALRQRILDSGGGTFEITLLRKDGSRFEAEITASSATNPDGTLIGFVNTIRDISEQKRRRTELELLATRDPLTDLFNRRVFEQKLAEEVARAGRHDRPLSIAMLDLDHFKAINDRCGHPAGDRVLREASSRLRALVREGEVLARVGGEEFAWILPDADGIGAFTAAERARRAICATPFAEVGTLTLSAGTCELAEAGTPELLCQRADQALYAAKAAGRNRTVRFTPAGAAALLAGAAPPDDAI